MSVLVSYIQKRS